MDTPRKQTFIGYAPGNNMSRTLSSLNPFLITGSPFTILTGIFLPPLLYHNHLGGYDFGPLSDILSDTDLARSTGTDLLFFRNIILFNFSGKIR